MRNKFIKTFSGVLFALIFCVCYNSTSVHAAAGLYNASDVLGQLDRNKQPTLYQGLITAKGMQYPTDVALDYTHHRLFALEYDRVLIFNLDTNNHLQSEYADNVIGESDFSTAQSGTTQNSLYAPQGMTYDNAHNRLFIGDSFNNRILVFDLSGGITNGMNATAVLGQPDFTSSTSSAGQNGLSHPQDLVVDQTTNKLFAADAQNNRVLIYDLSGGITNGMNATAVLGQPDFTSNTGSFSQNSFFNPTSISLDTSRHYVFISDNARVLAFDISSGITNGMNASYVIGQADFTSSASDTSHTNDTRSVAYDPITHRLYVTDVGHIRVLVYDVTSLSNNPSPSTVIGQPNFTSTAAGTTQNSFFGPMGLELDTTNQQLYVGDYSNHRILIFNTNNLSNGMNASGIIGQTDENGQPNYTGERPYGHNPSASSLGFPQGTTIDSVHHRMFIADCNWNRIEVYNLDANNFITSHTANYVLGQNDFSTKSNTATTQHSLNCPVTTAYDSAHDRLFTTDMDGRVLVYDLSGGITNNMNASYVLGKPDFTTSTGTFTPTQNELDQPSGLAYDATNNYLYVIDDTPNRILVFNLSSGITNGMNASYVIGQPNFTTQGCAITQSGVTHPFGLAIDTDHHRLFVADAASCSGSYAARVLVYDTSAVSNGMNASAVIGEPDFTTTHNPNAPTRSTVGYPTDLAYDAKNQQLFVNDDYSNRIMVFDVSTITNGEDATGVIGQQSFTSNNYDCVPNPTDLCDAEGVSDQFDSVNRRLYLSDSYNSRILVFNFARLVGTIPDGTNNTSYSVALGSQTQGTTTYTVNSGTLPAGMSLNSNTGVLSGTPTNTGNSTFSVTVSDNNGVAGTYTDTNTYTIHIADTASGGGNTEDTSNSNTETSTSNTNPTADTTIQDTTDTGDTTPTSNTNNESQPSGTPIALDTMSSFSTSGATVDIHEGDQLQYSLQENGTASNYHITVKKISDDSVDLVYESHDGDVTLHTGEQQAVSVGRGLFSIHTRLNSIVNGKANITFTLASAKIDHPLSLSKSSASPQPVNRMHWWYWASGIVVVGVACVVVYKVRQKSQS